MKQGLAVLACALLLSTMSYSGLAMLSVMADGPPDPTSSYLIVIDYDDGDDLERLTLLNLHWLDWQADRLEQSASAGA